MTEIIFVRGFNKERAGGAPEAIPDGDHAVSADLQISDAVRAAALSATLSGSGKTWQNGRRPWRRDSGMTSVRNVGGIHQRVDLAIISPIRNWLKVNPFGAATCGTYADRRRMPSANGGALVCIWISYLSDAPFAYEETIRKPPHPGRASIHGTWRARPDLDRRRTVAAIVLPDLNCGRLGSTKLA